MPKKITSIPIVGSKLRELLISRTQKIDEIAERLDCTRQTLHLWFTTDRIPSRQLLAVAKTFSFTAEELRQIRPKENLCILYRTLRDVTVPEETQAVVRSLAKEALWLNRSEALFRSNKVLALMRTKSPVEMANHIRRVLELPHYGIALEQLISALEAWNIPVIFFPFPESLVYAKVCAFTASNLDDRIIIVDSNCALEDVLWRIFHELAHIIAGHDSTVTRDDERFCDAVATEMCTPAKFFHDNHEVFKDRFSSNDLWRLPGAAREISTFLGASYLGVILALTAHKIISVGSAKQKYLMAVHHREKDKLKRVNDVLALAKETPLEFWTAAFKDPLIIKLIKRQTLTRDGVLSGRVSLERAAEIFDIDVGTMREMQHRWKQQDAESIFS